MTYEEYKKKRQERDSAATFTAYERYKYNQKLPTAESAVKDLFSRVQNWFNNNDTFMSDYKSRFEGRTGGYGDAYVKDSASAFNYATNQKQTFDKELQDILSIAEEYKDFLTLDYRTMLSENMKKAQKAQNDILKGYSADVDYWSQWKDENAYKEWATVQKQNEEFAAVDIEIERNNHDRYLKDLEKAKEWQNKLIDYEARLFPLERDINNGVKSSFGSEEERQKDYEALKAEVRNINAHIMRLTLGKGVDEFESYLSEKNAYLTQAERYQKGVELSSVVNAPDFEESAQRGLDTAEKEIENARLRVATGGRIETNKELVLSHIEDDEKKTYAYYLAKNDKDTAEKYIDSLVDTVNARLAGKRIDGVGDNAALSLLLKAEAGLAQWGAGLRGAWNMLTGDDAYVAPSAVQIAASSDKINQNLGEVDLKWFDFSEGSWKDADIFGKSLGQTAGDLVQTTANQLPSIMMSFIPVVGQGLSLASMGISASGNAYTEMINAGYSKEQARSYGMLVGGSEVLLGSLLDGTTKAGGALVQKLGGKSFKSFVDGIDNAFARVAINTGTRMLGEFTEESLQTVLESWFESVVTKTDYEAADWDEILYSGLLGALSAGALGNIDVSNDSTITGAIATTIKGNQVKKIDGGVSRLAKLGSTFSADTVAYKIADKVNDKTGAYTIGRLLNEANATLTEQNKSEIVRSLERKGITTEHANTIANGLAAVVEGAEFNSAQRTALESNPIIARTIRDVIINPNSTVNQRTKGLYNLSTEMSRGKSKTSNTDMTNAVADEMKSVEATESATTQKSTAEGKFKASDDGKTKRIETGEDVVISGIESIENGSVKVKLEDGKVVDASELSFGTSDEAVLYEMVSKMNVSPESATSLIKNFKATDGVSAEIYAADIPLAYQYGKINYAKGLENLKDLTIAQRQTAYYIGQNAASAEVKAKQAAIGATGVAGNLKTSNGGVRFEKGAFAKTGEEKRAVKLAQYLAKAIGIDIVFYDARTKARGENGYNANGYFDEKTNAIYLDLQKSRDDTKTIAFTMSHELTHFIKKWSPEKFKGFADFLMEQYGNTDITLETKMAQLGTSDADLAYEEMIADACETMLLDSNAVVKLMQLRENDLDLFEKIKLHVLELVNKIRTAYKNLGREATTDEAKALLKMEGVLEKLSTMFEDAAVDAAKNYQAVENSNETVFGKETVDVGAVESGVKNQLKAHKEIGEASIAYNDRHKAVGKAVLETGVEAMYEMAEVMLPYLEEEGILPPDIPGKTIFKNGSYGRTGENTTLCVRTLTYEDFKDRVAEKVGRPLTVSESLLVSQKIYDIATEPQCIYCYVAADRKAYDDYLGEYHKAMDKYIKAMREGGDSEALYTEYLAGRKDTNQQKKRWSQWEAIAKSGKEYISAQDLTTKRKRNAIIAKKNAFSEQIKDAQRYAQSASWAKTVYDYRAYKGEILKMSSKFVDMLNSEYGLRMYSFSDYTPAFIVENMQMIIDASVKGLKSLAYTKDTDYVEIFASTGQAINVSCFAKWDAESGTYVEDNRQGANWGKTKNLRKQYPNVGAVMVATNDAMVEWALKQDWVDVVIPYHIVKTGTTIANEYQWNNYTSEFSDKAGNKAANIYPTEHNNDFDTYSNLLKERGITPRFSRWYDMVEDGTLTEDQYMKLVNEVRLPASELSPVVPSFNLEAAKKSFGIDNEGKVIEGGFVDKGGYMGGWYRQGVDVNQEVMAVSEDIKAGKSSLDVDYGMSKSVKEKVEQRYKKQAKKKMTEEEKMSGKKIADFIDSVSLMLDQSKISKRKLKIGELSDAHKKTVEDLMQTLNSNFSAEGYELWIDGTGADHINIRHGENGEQDNSMASREDRELIPWATNSPDGGEFIREENGELKLSTRFFNADGSKAPQIRLHKMVDGETMYVSECVPDSKNKRIYITSAYKKSSTNQLLNIDSVESPQPTPEATFDSSATDGIIHQEKPIVKKQLKKTSDRTLLTEALESVAQNDIEKNKLAQYKEKIQNLDELTKKLAEIKGEIKELSFAKGSRDTKQIRELQDEATKTANRINIYDRQLLNLEATTALKNVLEREKARVRKAEAQKGKEALKAYREKAETELRDTVLRYQESRKNAIEGRHKTEMRHKIKGVVADLNKLLLDPTKDKHVPIGLQGPVAEALDIINMDTTGAEERVAKYNELIAKSKDAAEIERLTKSRDRILMQGDNLADKLASLKNAYTEFKESDDPLVRNAHNEVIENLISETVKTVGNTSLRDMNLTQLEAVYDMYKAILATVRNANKMFKADRQETISENSEAVKVEVSKVGGHRERVLKATKFLKKFGWNMLKPIYAMKLIGSDTLTRLYENVRAGEDTWAVDVNEAKEFFEEAKKKHKYSTWDFKKQYTFKDSIGNDFSLSLEQIMSLYAYSKRDQADKHLEVGGFIFDDAIEVKKKNKLGIPMTYEVNDANPYRLNRLSLGEVVKTLTPEQKGFIDEMQSYLSDVMGAKGNEVSLAMYDIKLYKEKNYFPLKTSRYFREYDPEKSGTPKIKNSGFSKKTVPQAGNPIVLSNFMDVWANHVNDMSMYHSFVLPLEDFMRVYNYSSTAGGYDSVQQYIKNAYGSQANAYVEALMNDLNGGARTDPATDIIGKGISLFKKAAVFASASVVIQQPSAIARALAYIDAKYFVDKPSIDSHKKTWAEVKKYAPVAIIKEMGYFDTNMGRSTVDWIKDEKTFRDKLDDVASKAPALADELAWCAIWKAVKRETLHTNPKLHPNSEAFLTKAGERFTEVVTRTQVYDSVLSRSALMRSKDSGAKMVTAFMAEPTTSLNMAVDAVIEGKRGNKKFAGKAVGAVASSVILNSILVSLVMAARDDDEDETYTEKYLESLTAELIEGFNPLTYIPFVKDIWSIMQGYDVERSDMSIWSDLWQSVESLFSDNKSGFEKVEGLVGAIASIFGIPLKNLLRDARAMYNFTSTLLSGTHTTRAGVKEAIGSAIKNSIPLYSRFEKSVGADKNRDDLFYEAIMSGNQAQIGRVKSQYKDEKAIESAMRKALREHDSRISEAAQARIRGDIAEYARIVKEITAEGKFVQDIVVGAVNAEINAINKAVSENKAPQVEEKVEEATSIYKADDINAALENGDMDLAKEIISELIEAKVTNGAEESKAKSTIKSSITKHWKPLYKNAYATKDADEMRRIRELLYATRLYGSGNVVVKTVQEWLKED